MIRMSSGLNGKLLGMFSFIFFSDLAKVWDSKTIADGMQFVVDMANKQQVFYSYWEETEQNNGKEYTGLAAFIQERKSKFVIICAGGGYGAVATMQEVFPTAKELNDMGYHVFVLQYRTGKYTLAPNPMDDLAEALKFILERETLFHLDVSDYAVIGFSAGGHLAASFGAENIQYINLR